MKNRILIFSLLLSISTFAQYKRFEIGAMAGMGDLNSGYDYRSLDAEIRFNFKNTFSIVTGVGLESGKFTLSDFHEFPYPIHYETSKVDFSNLNVPLLCRATFGKNRLFVYLQAGAQAYTTPKARGEVIRQYSTSDPNYPDEYYTKNYTSLSPNKIDFLYGGGLTFTITKDISIFSQFRDNLFKQYTPQSEKDDLRFYSHYKDWRVSVGISWHFNVKNNDFIMKTYFPGKNN